MNKRCDELEPLHSAWVDGELRTGERARLAAHLQRCARCRTAIIELRITSSMLRSLPLRTLPAGVAEGVTPGKADRRQVTGAGVRRVLVRSTAAMVLATATLGAAAFAVGSSPVDERQVAVPVDVFVADHLVRAVGGPVSTPALLKARP